MLAPASVVAALLFILNAWFNYKLCIYLFIYLFSFRLNIFVLPLTVYILVFYYFS